MRFSTVALVMVNAMLAMASPMVSPLAKRKLVTEYTTKCVTDFVYPDGSPARGRHHAKPTAAPEVPYVYHHQSDDSESEPAYTESEDRQGGRGKHGSHAQSQAPAEDSYGAAASSGNYADPGEDFIQNSLYHHNVHRHNHSAPDVTWSESLASAAQQLANSCNYGHNTDIGGYSGGYGQNIAMYAATNDLGTETAFIRTSITEYWYNNEIRLYGNRFGGEPNMGDFHEWGHFSQIVWKSTKEIGCAVAYCKSGLSSYPGYFSVCNYGPPGNYNGEYAQNVGAPLGENTVEAQ